MKRMSTQDAEFPFEFCSECGVEIEATLAINFTFLPAERGSRENGIQMEPDYPESIEINEAKVVFRSTTLHEFTDTKRFEPKVWEWLEAQRETV